MYYSIIHKCLILIIFQLQSSTMYNLFDSYYNGEIGFDQYMDQNLCNQSSSIYPTTISILIPNTKSYRKYYYCFNIIIQIEHYYQSELSDQLKKIIEKYSFKKLLIFFDLSFGDQTQVLSQVIPLMDDINFDCHNCLPINFLISRINRWELTKLIDGTKNNFRATFIDINSRWKTIHVRPILDGCFRYPGIWMARTVKDHQRMKIPYKDCDLQNRQLTINVNDFPPFCALKRERTNINVTNHVSSEFQTDLNILYLLEKRFNFRSSLLEADGFNEAFWNNNTWIGNVGRVYLLESELGICDITQSYSRLKYVDFTFLTHADSVSSLTLKPTKKLQEWIIGDPFDYIVWLALLGSMFLLTITIVFISRFDREEKSEKFGEIIFYLFMSSLEPSKFLFIDILILNLIVFFHII